MDETYKFIITNQEPVRTQLTTHMAHYRLSLEEMASRIGVATNTLRRLLKEEKNIRFQQIMKIKEYLTLYPIS